MRISTDCCLCFRVCFSRAKSKHISGSAWSIQWKISRRHLLHAFNVHTMNDNTARRRIFTFSLEIRSKLCRPLGWLWFACMRPNHLLQFVQHGCLMTGTPHPRAACPKGFGGQEWKLDIGTTGPFCLLLPRRCGRHKRLFVCVSRYTLCIHV